MASDEASVSWSRPWSILGAHWIQVAILTAAFALAYAVVVWLNASYVAKAMLRTPELTVAEFKRVIEAASDPAVIAEVAKRIFQGDDARAAAARDLSRDPFFADHFTPIYTISRADLRETSVAPPSAGQQIVAVQTRAESSDRTIAGRMAILLADAFADGALKGALVEYVTAQRGALATSRQRLEAKIAGDRASLARVEMKIRELQQLNAAYPQASRGDSRQVVSVADGGARYLSPVTQLVGASSDAIGIRDSIRESERKIRQGTWASSVFDEAGKLNVTALSGRGYMAQLESIVRSDSMRGLVDDEATREARSTLEAELSVFRGRYAIGYTMLRMPPERPPRAGPPLLAHAVGGMLTGLVLAVLLTLALHWKTGPREPANL
jgi:hypothetical protein